MKKIIIILAGLMAATAITGCGDKTTETTTTFVEVETVQTEMIIIEEIQTEATITERVFIDNEYQNEVDYNSRTNGWDNNPNITYWD